MHHVIKSYEMETLTIVQLQTFSVSEHICFSGDCFSMKYYYKIRDFIHIFIDYMIAKWRTSFFKMWKLSKEEKPTCLINSSICVGFRHSLLLTSQMLHFKGEIFIRYIKTRSNTEETNYIKIMSALSG